MPFSWSIVADLEGAELLRARWKQHAQFLPPFLNSWHVFQISRRALPTDGF